MEKKQVASTRALYHCLSLAEVFGLLILDSILNWANTLHKLCIRSSFTDSSSRSPHAEDWKKKKKKNNTSNGGGREEGQDRVLSRGDVEIVMARMGLLSSRGSDKLVIKDCICMGFDELLLPTVFEAEEPSLEEVNVAFSVFDENCDGFIDATELQTLLCRLGFSEGADLDACQHMIQTYDENQDGKIDFDEFVRFMESGFC